jgi:uncharacterized membrane protein
VVEKGPQADFTCQPTSGEGPLTVQFTDTSVAGDKPIVSWNWKFGDGGGDTRQHPQHTYPAVDQTTTYNVTLTVQDEGNKNDSLTKPCVTVNPKPTPPPPPPPPPVDECKGLGIKCMLCYLLFWFSGILFWMFAKNRCLKFHGMQSFFTFIILFLILFVVHEFAAYAFKIFCLITLLIWLFLLLKSLRCKIFKVPVIGAFCYRHIFGKS